ncbi:MAG: transposase [Chloroflexi bacterium]|nr:transposase [Chloroflexota bacterium]
MLTLPDAIVTVLFPFAILFQHRTWRKAQVLSVGTILTPGQRTVASALRVMGLSSDRNYARYHHVLNRAAWSPLGAPQVLLRLLIGHLDHGDGPLVFGIDETLERRQGPKINALGLYRDGVRSSHSYTVKASGLRWVSLMWLGHIPWAGRYWALPFLTVLAPSERYHPKRGRRHKKVTDWARQMINIPLMVSLPNHAGCRIGLR